MSSSSRAWPRTISALPGAAGPGRQPGFDHPRREIVQLGALELEFLQDERRASSMVRPISRAFR